MHYVKQRKHQFQTLCLVQHGKKVYLVRHKVNTEESKFEGADYVMTSKTT